MTVSPTTAVPRTLEQPLADPSRHQLGDFLRSRRLGLSVGDVGLPAGRRRRTAGLRREEVAELAGISVDWYIRLEQGRSVNPSVATIDAIAMALRLTPAEHAHVTALSRHGDRVAFVTEHVPESIVRTVQHLNAPAYITGRRWDVLAWNDAADELFRFSHVSDDDRNILVTMVTGRGARKLFGSKWADEAQRMVAQFRATHDLWAGDPAFIALTDRLRSGCPQFDEWWQAHDIRATVAGRKQLSHPILGRVHMEYTSFQATDDPALKLVIYTPVTNS